LKSFIQDVKIISDFVTKVYKLNTIVTNIVNYKLITGFIVQVLLPSDTNLGTIIYKLRAQDADENYPLTFTAYGKESSGNDVTNFLHPSKGSFSHQLVVNL
jgi:hypothetical protein